MPHALLILLLAAAAPADDAAVKAAASGLLGDGRTCDAMRLLLAHHERTGSAEAEYNAGLVALKANDRVRAARLLEAVADDAQAGRFREPSRRYASRIRRLIDREGPGTSCPEATDAGSVAAATPPTAEPVAAAPGVTPAPVPGPPAAPAPPARAAPGPARKDPAGGGVVAGTPPGPAPVPSAAPAPPAEPGPTPQSPAVVDDAPGTTGRTFLARLERETEVRTAGYEVESAAATPRGPAPAGTSGRTIAGYTLFAAGGVAMLVGGIFTASARSEADALEGEAGGSPPPIYDARRRDAFDAYQTNRTAGFAGLSAGALLATAAAILLLTEPAP